MGEYDRKVRIAVQKGDQPRKVQWTMANEWPDQVLWAEIALEHAGFGREPAVVVRFTDQKC